MENIHPMIVHFPIALLWAAWWVETLALLLKKPAWHRIALWNLGLGAVGAGSAVLTGRVAGATAKRSLEIHQVMELHERLGFAVLAMALGILGLRLFQKDRLSGRVRWLAWWVLAAICGIITFSAHLGGRMVYEYGVGGSYGRAGHAEEAPPQHDHHHHTH